MSAAFWRKQSLDFNFRQRGLELFDGLLTALGSPPCGIFGLRSLRGLVTVLPARLKSRFNLGPARQPLAGVLVLSKLVEARNLCTGVGPLHELDTGMGFPYGKGHMFVIIESNAKLLACVLVSLRHLFFPFPILQL